jgi:hypothetical protein
MTFDMAFLKKIFILNFSFVAGAVGAGSAPCYGPGYTKSCDYVSATLPIKNQSQEKTNFIMSKNRIDG